MNPNMIKEYLSSGFNYDIILAWCQNGYFRELFDNHNYIIITIIDEGKMKHIIPKD